MLLDLLLLALALYFLQEGRAQQAAPPDLNFFVEFPLALLPLAYAAVLLLLPNFAISAFTLWRHLEVRTWPWVTSALAFLCLAIISAKLGFEDVLTIINP